MEGNNTGDNTTVQPIGQTQQQTPGDKGKRAREHLIMYWHRWAGAFICFIGFVANADTVAETTAKYLPKALAILYWLLQLMQHASSLP